MQTDELVRRRRREMLAPAGALVIEPGLKWTEHAGQVEGGDGEGDEAADDQTVDQELAFEAEHRLGDYQRGDGRAMLTMRPRVQDPSPQPFHLP